MNQARRERAATKAECLANRIMALHASRCDAHRHYLCDECSGQWIEAFAAQEAEQASAQARGEEREAAKIEMAGKVLAMVEGGLFRGAVTGALKGAFKDHNIVLRFLPSFTKRVAGQVMATIRDGLGVGKAPSFDPWRAHCNTCQCGEQAVQRVAAALRAAPSPKEPS